MSEVKLWQLHLFYLIKRLKTTRELAKESSGLVQFTFNRNGVAQKA